VFPRYCVLADTPELRPGRVTADAVVSRPVLSPSSSIVPETPDGPPGGPPRRHSAASGIVAARLTYGTRVAADLRGRESAQVQDMLRSELEVMPFNGP
jgi:hypothetical protein